MAQVLTVDDVGMRPSLPHGVGIHVLPVAEHNQSGIHGSIIGEMTVEPHVRCYIHDPVDKRIPAHATNACDHVVSLIGQEGPDPGIEILLAVRRGA